MGNKFKFLLVGFLLSLTLTGCFGAEEGKKVVLSPNLTTINLEDLNLEFGLRDGWEVEGLTCTPSGAEEKECEASFKSNVNENVRLKAFYSSRNWFPKEAEGTLERVVGKEMVEIKNVANFCEKWGGEDKIASCAEELIAFKSFWNLNRFGVDRDLGETVDILYFAKTKSKKFPGVLFMYREKNKEVKVDSDEIVGIEETKMDILNRKVESIKNSDFFGVFYDVLGSFNLNLNL